MSSNGRIYSRQSSQLIDTPTMDYRPIAFMTLMVLTFWLMLSYITDSYFIVFLIFSNFILLFACCISLSGYILRRFIDVRSDPSVLEVSTISGRTPYIVQDAFPPSYEDAVRMGVVPCHHVLHGQLNVPSCVICTSHCHALKDTTEQPSQEASSTNLPSRDADTESTNIQETTRISTPSTSSSNDSVFLPDQQSTSTSEDPPPSYSEVESLQAKNSIEQNQRPCRNYRHHKKRPPEPPIHQQNQ